MPRWKICRGRCVESTIIVGSLYNIKQNNAVKGDIDEKELEKNTQRDAGSDYGGNTDTFCRFGETN